MRHRHDIIPDSRAKFLRRIWKDTLNEEIPEDMQALLDKLK